MKNKKKRKKKKNKKKKIDTLDVEKNGNLTNLMVGEIGFNMELITAAIPPLKLQE